MITSYVRVKADEGNHSQDAQILRKLSHVAKEGIEHFQYRRNVATCIDNLQIK